ncbi:MAG: hypothetical protein U0641_11820 [Anaerolineae bacterium]
MTNGHGTVPFVAWYEPLVTLQNKNNIFVSVLGRTAAGEFWQPGSATSPSATRPA